MYRGQLDEKLQTIYPSHLSERYYCFSPSPSKQRSLSSYRFLHCYLFYLAWLIGSQATALQKQYLRNHLISSIPNNLSFFKSIRRKRRHNMWHRVSDPYKRLRQSLQMFSAVSLALEMDALRLHLWKPHWKASISNRTYCWSLPL